MHKIVWFVAIGCGALTSSAYARPTGATTAYDLPYCDEVFAYCLQAHEKPECDRLAAEANQRGVWRIDFEREGYPETDMFTVSIEKKPGTANTYIETRQFGCHKHY
jgi:hypothetical protein